MFGLGHKLFFSIPRFSKKDYSLSHNDMVSSKVEKHDSSLNSYASVVKGVSMANSSKEMVEEILVLPSGDFLVEKHKCGWDRSFVPLERLVKSIKFSILSC